MGAFLSFCAEVFYVTYLYIDTYAKKGKLRFVTYCFHSQIGTLALQFWKEIVRTNLLYHSSFENKGFYLLWKIGCTACVIWDFVLERASRDLLQNFLSCSKTCIIASRI